MNESVKKPLLIAVVVGCLVIAAAVFYYTRSSSSSIPSEFAKQKIWVKCSDAECGNAYEMNKQAYFEWAEKNAAASGVPPMKCPKCGKDSVFQAEKCESCGEIFIYGSSQGFPDTCPKCGFSKTEEARKAAKQ
jgi:hypothetical protein